MVFELRTYTPSPGRLLDLLWRFEHVTLAAWHRLGIDLAGMWVTDDGDVVYMLRWVSRAERDTRWTAFQTDPDWIAKRADTEKNGTLVAAITGAFMEATSFSPTR